MGQTLILWLPSSASLIDGQALVTAVPWLRVDDSVVVDSGQDDLWVDAWVTNTASGAPSDQLVALAPAVDVPVRWRHYSDAAPAQAAAAARIDTLSDSLGDAADLHVVAGMPATGGQAVPVAVTTRAAMTAWQNWLTAHNLSPSAILPVAAIIPPPADEAAWLAEVGEERLIRLPDQAFLSDPNLDALIVGDRVLNPLPLDQMREALMLSLAAPPLDLLSGAWKAKRTLALDPAWIWWMKRMIAALIIVTLLVPIVHAVRLAADTRRADAVALDTAKSIGVAANDATGAEAELDRRLAASGGGPLAFSVPASALYAAMRDIPGLSLRALSHRTDGTLTITLAAPRVEDINQALLALQSRGYGITAQPMAGTNGEQQAVVTIRAVP